MGYYTDYYMRADTMDKGTRARIKLEFELFMFPVWEDYGFVDEGYELYTNAKWYEHRQDMVDLSKKFPDVLFTLKGVGEEFGDIWFEYYKGGKYQYCPVTFQFDDFDEDKLIEMKGEYE